MVAQISGSNSEQQHRADGKWLSANKYTPNGTKNTQCMGYMEISLIWNLYITFFHFIPSKLISMPIHKELEHKTHIPNPMHTQIHSSADTDIFCSNFFFSHLFRGLGFCFKSDQFVHQLSIYAKFGEFCLRVPKTRYIVQKCVCFRASQLLHTLLFGPPVSPNTQSRNWYYLITRTYFGLFGLS